MTRNLGSQEIAFKTAFQNGWLFNYLTTLTNHLVYMKLNVHERSHGIRSLCVLRYYHSIH